MSYVNSLKLKLKKAVAGSNQPFEISVFNANLDLIDNAAGIVLCTSVTRPDPYPGMTCFELDTKNTIVWNGGAWAFVTRHEFLASILGPDAATTDFTTNPQIVVQATFPVVAGATYKVQAHVQATQLDATGVVTVLFAGTVGTSPVPNLNIVLQSFPAGNTVVGDASSLYLPTDNGIKSIQIVASTSGGKLRFTPKSAQLWVERIG